MRETSAPNTNSYKPGDAWGICDECGLKYHMSELRERWDHAMVCKKDFEQRNQQELVRGRADKMTIPVARPEGTDTYITVAITQDDL